MKNNLNWRLKSGTSRVFARVLMAAVMGSAVLPYSNQAATILNPAGFTGTVTVINYSTSPVGNLPGSTSITNQYASQGVLHDGSTTTPPGPTGMSSLSGLPGLESPTGDRDTNVAITVRFTIPVNQVGAFFLMSSSSASITVSAYRQDGTLIERATLTSAQMPLRPGPYNFNEGFLGLSTPGEAIASVTFTPSPLTPFVIDDLHFAVIPEPPVIVGAAANPSILWPPNNKMVSVDLDAVVESGAGDVNWSAVAVDCNELHQAEDIGFVNDHTVSLRATRDGNGKGRVYTIWLLAIDSVGNESKLKAVEVIVPHDMGRKRN